MSTLRVEFRSFGLFVEWFKFYKDYDGDGSRMVRETFIQPTLGM
jgi:hypothetical protein